MNQRLGILAAAFVLLARPAFALQPLGEFVASAKKHNFDVRESNLTAAQRDTEAEGAQRKLWPTLGARGVYTHNQFEGAIRQGTTEIIITPQNQFDAYFTLDVPLVDFSSWARVGAANALRDAAQARAGAQFVDVEQAVSRGYYQLLAARGLLGAAQKTQEAANQSLHVQEQRKSAGLAIELDYQRALAEAERAKQNVANAEYLASSQARAFTTLTGLAPEPGGALPEDDLHEEAPLATFLRRGEGDETPAIAAARLEAKAADKTAAAQWYTLLPSLSGNATERLTNATGFAGRYGSYAVSATLTWKLDASAWSTAKAQDAAQQVSVVRKERASRQQSDAVTDAYELVRSNLTNCRAARAESRASALAYQMATERYGAGTALQLDVLQANRQAFQAEVTRIQADVDLAVARATLRIVSGRAKEGAR